MALTNSQYNAVLREYEALQAADRADRDRRRQAVYRAVPEILSLDRQAAISAMDRFRKAVRTGDSSVTRDFPDEVRRIAERKRELLLANGFAEDELELRYSCPDCRDTGFTSPGVKCACFRRRVIKRLYEQSNLDRILEKENFSRFRADYYSADRVIEGIGMTERACMEKVFSFLKHFTERFPEEHGSILFQGSTGVGKTFLSNCIAAELIGKCFAVVYLTAPELFECMGRVRIDRTDDPAVQERYEALFDCDLLIIDDLGTEVPNAMTASQLFTLVSARLQNRKGTVISTNLSMRSLRDLYSERITSRIAGGYDIIRLYGDDIRRKKLLNEQE